MTEGFPIMEEPKIGIQSEDYDDEKGNLDESLSSIGDSIGTLDNLDSLNNVNSDGGTLDGENETTIKKKRKRNRKKKKNNNNNQTVEAETNNAGEKEEKEAEASEVKEEKVTSELVEQLKDQNFEAVKTLTQDLEDIYQRAKDEVYNLQKEKENEKFDHYTNLKKTKSVSSIKECNKSESDERLSENGSYFQNKPNRSDSMNNLLELDEIPHSEEFTKYENLENDPSLNKKLSEPAINNDDECDKENFTNNNDSENNPEESENSEEQNFSHKETKVEKLESSHDIAESKTENIIQVKDENSNVFIDKEATEDLKSSSSDTNLLVQDKKLSAHLLQPSSSKASSKVNITEEDNSINKKNSTSLENVASSASITSEKSLLKNSFDEDNDNSIAKRRLPRDSMEDLIASGIIKREDLMDTPPQMFRIKAGEERKVVQNDMAVESDSVTIISRREVFADESSMFNLKLKDPSSISVVYPVAVENESSNAHTNSLPADGSKNLLKLAKYKEKKYLESNPKIHLKKFIDLEDLDPRRKRRRSVSVIRRLIPCLNRNSEEFKDEDFIGAGFGTTKAFGEELGSSEDTKVVHEAKIVHQSRKYSRRDSLIRGLSLPRINFNMFKK